jgi:hypothetical protein
MPPPEKHDSKMLLTLERYRNLALEEAQNLHAQCAEVLEKENATHTKLEEALQSTYTVHRTFANEGRPLSPDVMKLSYYHARAQAAAVAQARITRDRTQLQVRQAQDQLTARLEEFKVIERLRENRRRHGTKWEQRRAQLQLDALGIIKACQVEGRWPSAE